MASRIRLRQVAAAFVLVNVGIGLALNFSESLASTGSATFDKDSDINTLRDDFASQADNVEGQYGEVEETNPEENQFFLTSVFNIMGSVIESTTNLFGIANSIQQALGIPIPFLNQFVSLVLIGVFFAFVSAARGWDV